MEFSVEAAHFVVVGSCEKGPNLMDPNGDWQVNSRHFLFHRGNEKQFPCVLALHSSELARDRTIERIFVVEVLF